MTSRIVAITGMTCAACEGTVSDAVIALPGVTSAVASARSGRLTLTGEDLPSDRAVATALVGSPYGVGIRPWVSRAPDVWRDLSTWTVVVIVVAAVIAATGLTGAVTEFSNGAATGSALFILALGVAASVSTCMALVGGLVVSMAASVPSGAKGFARMRPHLAFNGGRIVGFGVLGGLIGWAGSGLSLQGPALAIAMLAAALVMGILGIRLTGVSPRLAAWQVALPASWGTWARRPGATAGSVRAGLLGAASFFLPCGFTQAVQVYALSTGNAREGALVMALFAVGTTPGLLAAGAAASVARGASAERTLRAVGVVVMAFAIVTGAGAVTTLAPGLGHGGIVATERTPNVVDVDGVQSATTHIVPTGYDPAVTVVYVGEPVSWRVAADMVSCAGLLDASSLGLGRIDAVNTDAVVTFTIEEPGTYRYACTMGMYDGAIVAIERPSAAGTG